MMRARDWFTGALASVVLCAPGLGEEKPSADGEPPRVLVAAPLGVAPGVASTVTLRGLRLDTASAVEFPGLKQPVKASIKAKGKADVPNGQDAKEVGDTQVEVEVTLPAETPAGSVPVVVVTPEEKSKPHRLLVVAADSLVVEQEPNNGLRTAQPVSLAQTVLGRIHQPKDPDAFRFTGRAGQKIVIAVEAARHGSALDPLLMLHDARGRILELADDRGDERDALVPATLPADGAYYVSVIDSHDRGGPAHVYSLSVRPDQ